MGNKNYRLESFNDFAKLSTHKETPQQTELLNLFATYVYMTNPDYKYNETYFKDMISMFWSNLEKYKKKLEFREKLRDKINNYLVSNTEKCQLNIQIDETWELKYDNFSDINKGKWQRAICEIPIFNFAGKEKIYLKCRFSNDQGFVFSDYLVSKDEEKLIKFASISLNLL